MFVILAIAPTLAACPYINDLGDNTKFYIQDTSAIYATHHHDLGWGAWEDHRHTYQWGWGVGANNWRFRYNSAEIKKLDQRVNSESQVGHFTVFDDLNSNDDNSICGFGLVAYDAKQGTQAIPSIPPLQVPCRVRQIALDHLAAGRTSYFGRAGEILVLAAFIILHEYMTATGHYWNPNWYWSSRQILSATGITYYGTLPDFKVRWPSTVTDWTRGQCFFTCWVTAYGFTPDNEALIDAMEVKTTSVGANVLRLAETDLRATSGYSAYIPAGVKFENNWINIYFEFAQYQSEFRWGG